jgi:CO dehydrogenase nickel-insertion accessory protein CooC1
LGAVPRRRASKGEEKLRLQMAPIGSIEEHDRGCNRAANSVLRRLLSNISDQRLALI